MARTDAGDDDVELLRRATRGDQAAAAEFYRRQAQYVWSVVRRFSLDDDEAMDASQEAFLRIFRGTFSGKSSLRTWIFRVATSAAIDLLRSPRAQRHDALEGTEDHPRTEPEADPALRARIAAAIAGLPVAQREVFLLCEIMDVQHEEAAAMLGVPVGTSRRRLFDAKARLRAALADVMQEWKR